MSKKRKSDETPTNEIPTATVASPEAQSATAVAEPPVEPQAETSFAEKVGQRPQPPIPDPFGVASDSLAGVRLFDSRKDRRVAIKFDEKPSQAVIHRMKEAGYHWNPADQIWAHPVGGNAALSTRIAAEQLYQEVRQMIRQEKGIEATQDIPF